MIVHKKGWHRTATTSLPLLHSCPGGVRRELVVSAGAKVTFSEFLNKEVGSFFKEFLVELSHSLLAFSHWPVSMLECLNDWMREGMMNIECRLTSAANARRQCPMSNAQQPMPKWGTWKMDIECSALIIASRRDVLRLCVTFVHTSCESSIRACLSADRHSWPTIRWAEATPKKMVNWMMNIEWRI